jgi:hypothetical protein
VEELERHLEQLAADLTPEQRERVGFTLKEVRQGVAALRLANTVREDVMEALELALRF